MVMIAIANWCGNRPADSVNRQVIQTCRQTTLTCWKASVKGESDLDRLLRCLGVIKL